MRSLWLWISMPFRRSPRGPLAARQPKRDADTSTPLGMEAIDMSLVGAAQRRNAALERPSTLFARNRRFSGFLDAAETSVTALPDDETYAARDHRAYMSRKGSSNDR
jgi:hypothetical protein